MLIRSILGIHVLSFHQHCSVLVVGFLDLSKSINIHSRDCVIFVLLKKLHVFWLVMDDTSVDHLEEREEHHLVGHNLSSVVLTSDHNCWLFVEMLVKLLLDRGLHKPLWLDEICLHEAAVLLFHVLLN